MTESHPNTRKARKAATRQALKDAALGCFGELGYAETSIEAITRAAGVAHGTFYVHFASKEGVLDELLGEFGDGLTARLGPALMKAARAPSYALVERMAGIFLDYWQEQRRFIESYAQRVAGGLNVVALRDGLTPQLVQALSGGLEAMARSAGGALAHPELVTQAIVGMWLRVGLQYLFNDQVSRKAAIGVLARLSWGAAQALMPELASAVTPPETSARGRSERSTGRRSAGRRPSDKEQDDAA